jgi:hypothetical protein
MHHVCQALHARSKVVGQCSRPILVPPAEHRVRDEDARTRRADSERGVRERGRRWSVMLD